MPRDRLEEWILVNSSQAGNAGSAAAQQLELRTRRKEANTLASVTLTKSELLTLDECSAPETS